MEKLLGSQGLDTQGPKVIHKKIFCSVLPQKVPHLPRSIMTAGGLWRGFAFLKLECALRTVNKSIAGSSVPSRISCRHFIGCGCRSIGIRSYSAAAVITKASDSATLGAAASSSNVKWTPKTVRVGALGIKKGMMSFWDSWGRRYPVTVVHVSNLPDTIFCDGIFTIVL